MDEIKTGKEGAAADISGGLISRSAGVYDIQRMIIFSVACLVMICTSACSFSRHADHSETAISREYVKCSPVKKGTAGQSVLKCHFGYDQSNLFTPTGRKVTIHAESGERLELWWIVDWFEGGKWYPRWTYVLFYIPLCSKQDESCVKMRIGECHFSEGCNFGQFLAPDVNGNGIPDSFSGIIWDSWDYGDDDGVEGYLDHVRHMYNPLNGYYTVTKYLYHYPPACKMPMSPREDVCLIKETCRPPYRIFKEEKIESRYLVEPSGMKKIE